MTPPAGTSAAFDAAQAVRDAIGDAAAVEAAGDQPTASASLLDAVTDLRRDVAATRLPLPLHRVERALAAKQRLLDQLDDHLLPRLRQLSAPAVVVVAGSTGAGKSTLVNSLLREEVSPAGVLRPTTRQAVIAYHPSDARLLTDHPLLQVARVVAHAAVPRGLALVDAPDLDSVLASNRETAHRLLEAADLWVFMTTAARYGDALPWEVLKRAVERGTSLAMVLNRVPPEAEKPVRADLMARLRERDLAGVPLFMIPDLGPHEGLLPVELVAATHRWLAMVAGPDRARSVIARTQRGSLRALRPWVDKLADAVQEQVDARSVLHELVGATVAKVVDRARKSALSGGVAAGPVQARWSAAASGSGPLAGQWGSRRGRSARQRALADLASELESATVVVLTAARGSATQALVDKLRSAKPPGAAGLLDALAVSGSGVVTAPKPKQSARDWTLEARQEVRDLRSSKDRKTARGMVRLVRAVGEDGAAAVVSLAAAGVADARGALTAALGREVSGAVVGRVAGNLAERVAEQARFGAAAAESFLAASDLADDAASRLRLRLAVLKRLT